MPVPYGSMLHIPPTSSLLQTAKQEPYKKAYLLTRFVALRGKIPPPYQIWF